MGDVVRTAKLDNFTSIQQRRRDCFEGVGGTNEQNLTEIDGYIDVVVLSKERV